MILIGLVALIALVMLFGAAAVKGVLGRVILFCAAWFVAMAIWAVVSGTSTKDWLLLGALLVTILVTCVISAFVAQRSAAAARERALQNVWDCYEEKGAFARDDVRARAEELKASGYAWDLDNYCRSILPPPNSSGAADRVWGWYAEDIEQKFDSNAKVRAKEYCDAGDALNLDRFCRETLAALPDLRADRAE